MRYNGINFILLPVLKPSLEANDISLLLPWQRLAAHRDLDVLLP